MVTNQEFQSLIEDSVSYLRSRIEWAREEYRVGEYKRYDYDLDRRTFWWSDDGVTKVRATLTVVGSVSTDSDTWLWSWGNPHFEGLDMVDILRVRKFGERHGIHKLASRLWSAEEMDGWEMMAVAARLLESQAGYRSPSETGFLFLLLDNLRWEEK